MNGFNLTTLNKCDEEIKTNLIFSKHSSNIVFV